MFLAQAYLKFAVFTIPGFVGYFASLGLPAVMACAVIALELLGGIALVALFLLGDGALALKPAPRG